MLLGLKDFSSDFFMILFVLSKQTIMKKLANVSPFILLLVPIFVMMLLTFTTSINATKEQENITAKTTASTSASMMKVNTSFVK
jgi:uncharacterized membrane protein